MSYPPVMNRARTAYVMCRYKFHASHQSLYGAFILRSQQVQSPVGWNLVLMQAQIPLA